MVKQEYINKLVAIQGFAVTGIHFIGKEEKELVIEIEREEARYCCPCGREYAVYYDAERRVVRDLSFGVYQRVWSRPSWRPAGS